MKKNKLFLIISSLFIFFFSFSCSFPGMREYPKIQPNFDQQARSNYRLSFAVGDKFKTLHPMFLVRSTSGFLWVRPPNSMSPSLADYLAKDGKTQYDVKRLLPSGTLMEIVSIKDSSMGGPIPYFLIEGETRWVKAYFGVDKAKKKDGNYTIYVDYDKDLYKPISR